jgi:hypothetical protein
MPALIRIEPARQARCIHASGAVADVAEVAQ